MFKLLVVFVVVYMIFSVFLIFVVVVKIRLVGKYKRRGFFVLLKNLVLRFVGVVF